MVRKRRVNSTQPTRKGPGRRGGSSIKDEKVYVDKVKAELGDEQTLRDHEKRHQAGATNPCELNDKKCDQYFRWLILELLQLAETGTHVGSDLRELARVIMEQATGARRTVAILEGLIPRLGDHDVVRLLRDYFDHQRESTEKIWWHLFSSSRGDRFLNVIAEHPMERFRENAIMLFGLAGYRYQDIAKIVDDGEQDRTRKSRGWRAAQDELKRRGKRPPAKPRVPRHHRQPGEASTAASATPAVATAARAEVTAAATERKPAGAARRAPAPKRRASERRVEEVKHLIDEPALDQDLDSGPGDL